MSKATTIAIEVSPGELIDKISILEIKLERILDGRRIDRQGREIQSEPVPDGDKLLNVRAELMRRSFEPDQFMERIHLLSSLA